MKLGISSYTYTWAIGVPGYERPKKSLSLIGLIDQAKEFGVGVVQVCDNLPLHKLDRQELELAREEAVNSGIEIEVGTRGVEPIEKTIVKEQKETPL